MRRSFRYAPETALLIKGISNARFGLTEAGDAYIIAGYFEIGLALKKNDKRGPSYIELQIFASVGTQLVVSIFIGFGGGYWLDKWLGSQPFFMLIGVVMGVAAGFLNIYRTVTRGNKGGNGPGDNG